jgi:hypothetical protein
MRKIIPARDASVTRGRRSSDRDDVELRIFRPQATNENARDALVEPPPRFPVRVDEGIESRLFEPR